MSVFGLVMRSSASDDGPHGSARGSREAADLGRAGMAHGERFVAPCSRARLWARSEGTAEEKDALSVWSMQ